ncbi:flagellar hook-associated protein FlgK [Rhizobium sp. RU36D]|uniref:flagellar hook-associated protein FlgK n=1 Tax=Rhizobium sp. RU36D TaxID=1907415 RepID=UPI0009D7D96D|nr:flagellar hook-associated protein FlgK [Rhizobium sp. RU36D]SMC84958.1 flagellar hook-associated protein 1 FlgK [Rhizobium sp. RU36D]
MTLASAMQTANSIFRNTGEQTSIISKNIQNAGNANYVRRSAVIMTSDAGASFISTDRSQNNALQRQMFLSTSQSTAQETLLDGLEFLKSALGGNDNELAPSTLLVEMRDKLAAFAARPGEVSLAETAISAAGDLATSINKTASAIQKLRLDSDTEIAQQVSELNTLLAKFETVNNTVVSQTASGDDPNDALDQRDALIKSISAIIGVNTVTRDNNDVVLYTSEGITLFERVPRAVTFAQTAGYAAATVGNSLYIDGTAVGAGSGGDTTARGSLGALLQLRDDIAPKFQIQLDELARGLVEAFSETIPATPGSAKPGLFTWSGGTTPTTGVVVPGISATFQVNSAVLTSKGGNPMLLRDGGINGATYVRNTSGGSAYSDLLEEYAGNLEEDRTFAASSMLDTSSNLFEFSSDSVGWIEGLRSQATTAYENKTAMLSRATEAYSNETGVSLDEELSLLLDVEQSYKASTKLVSAIDEMLQALLNMV